MVVGVVGWSMGWGRVGWGGGGGGVGGGGWGGVVLCGGGVVGGWMVVVVARENLPRRVWNRQTKFTYNYWQVFEH